MVINQDKCKHKRNVTETSYSFHGQTLKETSNVKYTIVTIHSKLSWNSHIDAMTKRVNRTTAFLYRNLSSYPKDVKAKTYKSTARVCFDSMEPCNRSNIAILESVQWCVARFCCNDCHRTSTECIVPSTPTNISNISKLSMLK